jgi:hypothetical protein
MKSLPRVAIVLILLATVAPWLPGAEEAEPAAAAAVAKPSAAEEKEYAEVLEKRAADVLDALDLKDEAKAARVRDAVKAQYRGLRDLHDERDARMKAEPSRKDAVKAETESKVKALHERYLATLAKDLTPEQVERVKDKMTYDLVPITYKAFQDMLPDMTDAQKAHVLAQLKEARELAMDGGSSDEKHAVFGKYKGRINNYLSKEGYDLKQASKDWAERRKAAAATRPS